MFVDFASQPPALPGPCSSGAACGRCALASRDLAPGDVAFKAPPLAAMLQEQCVGRHCDFCFVAGLSRSRCSRCKASFYCGRACQEADWKDHHKLECGARAVLEEALAAAGLPGPDALQDALLAGRCVRAAAATTARSGSLADLESREGRLTEEERSQLWCLAKTLAAAAPQLLAVQKGCDAEPEKAALAFGALCCFRNNNFAVTDDLFIAVAAGCFPRGAALNHSCKPNCLLAYELEPGQPPQQVLRVLQPVAAGHELTHSYVDLALPSWQRREQLREVYGFDCSCAGCADLGSHLAVDTMLCSDIQGTGAAAVDAGCPIPPSPPCPERDSALAAADALLHRAAAEEDAIAELAMLEQVQGLLFSCVGQFETSPFSSVSVVICAVYNRKIVHPEVCKHREKWLHPRHMEVASAHASAHTAAMAALNWEASERHCEKLVEQYLAVYPAWHPISGLSPGKACCCCCCCCCCSCFCFSSVFCSSCSCCCCCCCCRCSCSCCCCCCCRCCCCCCCCCGCCYCCCCFVVVVVKHAKY
ncbi:unnamed protein product [Polarella glacialis]|uniref:MYND-type domain-containing protein n=1 Tax=Polarella glacialis TaxID=89957 RepID=A0A813K2V4_POLGL|nr:unnamed protein product [Polarella glacialis]